MARKITGKGFEIIDTSDDFMRAANTETEKVVEAYAGQIKRDAKTLLNRSSSPPSSAPGAPPHKRTGTLGRSIEFETFQRKDVFGARIGTNLNYGFWLEIGTKGGKVIKPKSGKVLSWVGKDGKRVFARSVTMKPLAARPYLRPALSKNIGGFEKRLAKAYDNIKTPLDGPGETK